MRQDFTKKMKYFRKILNPNRFKFTDTSNSEHTLALKYLKILDLYGELAFISSKFLNKN